MPRRVQKIHLILRETEISWPVFIGFLRNARQKPNFLDISGCFGSDQFYERLPYIFYTTLLQNIYG